MSATTVNSIKNNKKAQFDSLFALLARLRNEGEQSRKALIIPRKNKTKF